MDCEGVCWGSAEEDCAGVCNGDYVICDCPSDGTNCNLPENCPGLDNDFCCPTEPNVGCGCNEEPPQTCPDGSVACANLGQSCCIDCGPICAACGAGTFDNCEESECHTVYCDFVDNTYPWPNSCTPKPAFGSPCCNMP